MSSRVAILIIAHKPQPDKYETISILQAFRIFSARDIFLICPEGLDTTAYRSLVPGMTIDFINPAWQRTYQGFNRLKVMPFLYERYKQYPYILFYEPDAFAFRDELDEWCGKNFDYLGAPWFDEFSSTEGHGGFKGVGNGGFSLRKTAAHLKVLHSWSYVIPTGENWRNRFVKKQYGNNLLKQAAGFLLDHTIRNNTHWRFNSYQGHEDQFWGLDVPAHFSWFRLPSYEDAAKFAFEMQPRRLFELTRHELPFGCHAWWKYDLEFWKPHIENFGYQL